MDGQDHVARVIACKTLFINACEEESLGRPYTGMCGWMVQGYILSDSYCLSLPTATADCVVCVCVCGQSGRREVQVTVARLSNDPVSPNVDLK